MTIPPSTLNRRRLRRTAALLALAVALAGAGCGGGESRQPNEEQPTAAAAATTPVTSESESDDEETTMNIRLTIGDTTLEATVLDNATSRDFASLLPLTLTLSDQAGTEKVSDLPRELSTADAPDGVDPAVGDIAYYAPWGNLAIFYKDFGYSSGLIRLGSIESGIEALAAMSGDFTVTIEVAS